MKDELIQQLDVAVRERFGNDAFTTEGDQLAENQIVYRSQAHPELEISIVAAETDYSIQVEQNYGQPDFDVLLTDDNLSLEDVLAILEKYRS